MIRQGRANSCRLLQKAGMSHFPVDIRRISGYHKQDKIAR
jgi:hypothetical protein